MMQTLLFSSRSPTPLCPPFPLVQTFPTPSPQEHMDPGGKSTYVTPSTPLLFPHLRRPLLRVQHPPQLSRPPRAMFRLWVMVKDSAQHTSATPLIPPMFLHLTLWVQHPPPMCLTPVFPLPAPTFPIPPQQRVNHLVGRATSATQLTRLAPQKTSRLLPVQPPLSPPRPRLVPQLINLGGDLFPQQVRSWKPRL